MAAVLFVLGAMLTLMGAILPFMEAFVAVLEAVLTWMGAKERRVRSASPEMSGFAWSEELELEKLRDRHRSRSAHVWPRPFS